MSKSSNSQYLYREVVVDPVILATVYLGDAKYQSHEVELMEEFKELQDDLVTRVMEVINTQLTERQREVMIKTYIEQRTQMEVADLLGVCQTTIHKIISGTSIIPTADGGTAEH
jgi:DNA-directed RNA polymerase specialized sigma subunit